MKKLQSQQLNTRLFAVFFAAIFVISLAAIFAFSHLLDNMEKEEYAINTQLLNSVTIKVDEKLDEIGRLYTKITLEEEFKELNAEPSAYKLSEMWAAAKKLLYESKYISSWSIFLNGSDLIVGMNGCYPAQEYISKFFASETFSADFWGEVLQENLSKRYYPETTFSIAFEEKLAVEKALVPLVRKSYYSNSMMLVLLLDMRQLCADTDVYLDESVYFFSESGELIYSTDSDPVIAAIPDSRELKWEGETMLAVQSRLANSSLVCVKLLPESQVMSQVRSNYLFCLSVAVVALVITVIMVLLSIRRMMHPVNRMLDLLRQHSDLDADQTVHSVCQELEQILENREMQAAMLAQRDATLSEYYLQSQFKNVYVKMDRPPKIEMGNAYILYILVQYQEKTLSGISMSRAELENCLQEMLSSALNRLFETTVVFQLEPGRFAARVSLTDDRIQWRMDRFMMRLGQEQEFTYFTVVQSEALAAEDDLAAVYSQVQNAARQAVICEHSQLLTLPLPVEASTGFTFSNREEKQLYAYANTQRMEDAAAFASEILDANLQRGISYAQMEVLCIAIVNTVSHAVADLTISAEKIAAASGIYNMLTTKCTTAKDYRDTVLDFIQSASGSEVPPVEDDGLLRNIHRYIRSHYREAFTGEDMAKALYISRSYLSTYYKGKTGMNLSDSIQLFRIQKAVELLKDNSINIGDVGPMVGIPSSDTFLRQFRKHTGTTPKEWRRKNHK